jgi:hypothetical protein
VEGRVPVGEQQRDEQEAVEQHVQREPPRHELHWHHRVDDALALCLVRLVTQLEGIRLETMVSGFLMRLFHMC